MGDFRITRASRLAIYRPPRRLCWGGVGVGGIGYLVQWRFLVRVPEMR